MAAGIRAAGLLFTSVLVLAAFLVLNPFAYARRGLIGFFGAGPDEARVENMFRDPATQEVSRGESPLRSFDALRQAWSECPREERVVLVGNSQMHATVLAPGEVVSSGSERTWADHVAAHYAEAPRRLCVYRLSAPNLSYMEALWYLLFLTADPGLSPGRIVLQFNFESFRKFDLRDGMLELLTDPGFARRVAEQSARSDAHVATFEQARRRFAERQDLANEVAAPASASGTGLMESGALGPRAEARFRAELARLPGFQNRHQMKSEFLDLLYLLRVHVLGITPTTRRSLGGIALDASLSSLERIAELSTSLGIDVVTFNAPQNPASPLYLTERHHTEYLDMIRDYSGRHRFRHVDLENGVPAALWGVWIDGPDPIHVGRAGHLKIAELVIRAGLIE